MRALFAVMGRALWTAAAAEAQESEAVVYDDFVINGDDDTERDRESDEKPGMVAD